MAEIKFDSQELFQAFISNSPLVAYIKDEAGRYVYINDKMETSFQVAFDNLIGKTNLTWLPREVAIKLGENDQTVLSTGQVLETLEIVPTTGNDSRLWTIIKFPLMNAKGSKFVGGVAIDVTGQKDREEKLRRSEQHYRHLVEDSQGFICTHDQDGKILSINQAAAQSLGYEVNELIGRNMREFMDSRHHESFERQSGAVWSNQTDAGLMMMMTKDGKERVWKYNNAKLIEDGETPYILGYAQDVTDMQEAQKHLKSLTLTDDLTGLYNRRGFLVLGERQLKIVRSRRNDKIAYLLFTDIDGLKQINDSFGHNSGSMAITKMGEILAGNFRATDIIARLGGDEFVVLVVDAENDTQEIVVNRLQKKIADYNAQKNHPFDLSLSVGITPVTSDEPASIEEMLIIADRAMYEQKRSKKYQQ